MALQYINITSGTETYKSTYNKINNNLSEQFVSGSYSNELLNLYRFDGSIYTISGFTGSFSGITSNDIITALGYTPYDSTNPNLYISSITSSNIIDALGYVPLSSVTLVTGYSGLTVSGDLSGSTLSDQLTLTLQNVTTGKTVGSLTQIPIITYDSKGRILSSSTVNILNPTLTQWNFSDYTKKLKGINITMQYYSETAYWRSFYYDWSLDSNFFYKYISPQIDWAKYNGCNSVRMIGCVAGIIYGTYTLTQYNTMQNQIITYLVSQNMYYYPCLGSLGDGLTYPQFIDTTSTGYTTQCVSVCQNFTNYTNVIGVDMCNEIFFTTGSISSANQITFISTLKTAITTSGITLPCTASLTGSVEGMVTSFDRGNSNVTAMTAYFDFIDRHVYTTNTYEAPDNLTYFNKPIIYGEYGSNSSLSARILSMPPLLAANGVNGGFMFCQNSYDNLSPNQYSLYDPNYIPLDPLASIYFSTLIPNQGYQKKLTKVFLASFFGTTGTALSGYTSDLNSPVSIGTISGNPTLNANNQLSMPLSSFFRLNGMANGDMVRSQIITLIALSEIRYQFYNAANAIQYTCRLVTNAGNTTVTMEILNAAGASLATTGALTTSYVSNFEMWYDGSTIRIRNGLTNIGISASAASLTCDHMILVNNAGGTAVIKQVGVFRP